MSYWLQNKGQPSHRFTTSEQPQQRNGQRADKAFKDVVITVSNTVTHDSYVLVKGKNHIHGSLDSQIRRVANMAKLAKVQVSTQKYFAGFFPSYFPSGSSGMSHW